MGRVESDAQAAEASSNDSGLPEKSISQTLNATPDAPDSVVQTAPVLYVGIGASAGGLEALRDFFDHMNADSDAAFIVVQHLSPDFESLMDELLARNTSLLVENVVHGVEVLPIRFTSSHRRRTSHWLMVAFT